MVLPYMDLKRKRERERERTTDLEAKVSNSATLTTHRVDERAVKEMNKQ